MTTLIDVALPKVNILGSTMAYREAGDRESSVVLFCTGIRPRRTCGGMSFHTLRR
jgi:hypothetical protein